MEKEPKKTWETPEIENLSVIKTETGLASAPYEDEIWYPYSS